MLSFLKRTPLFTPEETEHLVGAIRSAEAGNKGEVRVHVEKKLRAGDPLDRAEALYHELGMADTEEDTGVLLYLALDDHKAAVWAGKGIHDAPGEGFWQHVIEEVAEGYRRGDGLRGITRALSEIGDVLREYVPGEDSAGNELPDAVTTS